MTDETTRGTTSGAPSPGEDAPPRRAERSRSRGLWHAVREVVSVAVIALVISFLIKTFVMQAFWIPSGSMENTLLVGDRVLVSKIQAGPMDIDRGDIVVFEDPGGWLPPTVPVDRGPVLTPVMEVLEFVGLAPVAQGNHLIKRVIGVGGDEVACCDDEGRMSVNGTPLEEDYLYPGDEPSQTPFEVTVPEGHVWLMGDHRSNSRDSRGNDDGTGQAGSVPEANVVGQAMVLVWPLSRAEWFDNPETLSQVPAP